MRSAILASCLVSLFAFSATAGDKPDVVRLLPTGDLGNGLKSTGAPEHFVGKKLFDYMNGGAELYLAFGFDDLGVGAYKHGDRELRVAIYKMGGPEQAFGIYAYAARGKKADLGGPNSITANMLSFFKGRFYVRVLNHKASKGGEASMLALGKKIYAGLPGKSVIPESVSLLPEGSIPGTLRYLVNAETARTTWFDGEGKLLMTDGATAVTAMYPGDDDDVQLTRGQYVDAKAAMLACKALAKKLNLKVVDKGGECIASGKTPDDVYAAIESKVRILRWSSGLASADAAKAWLPKIK